MEILMQKIMVTSPIPKDAVAAYKNEYDIVIPQTSLSHEEILADIASYDALFVLEAKKIDREIIEKGISLKAIANFGVGFDSIDVACASQHGIAVINTPTAVTEVTAEHTLALILTVMRSTARYDREIRKGVWYAPSFETRNTLVSGSVIGIVGFGRIGKQVARKAQGLGMNVVYYDKFRLQPEEETALQVRYMPFEDLLAASDVISLHMPYFPENHHLFNSDTFSRMKPSAYFVNMSRGPIVCETDLFAALKENRIKGAALDVFEQEPTPYEGLKDLDNIVMTPHVGSSTPASRYLMVKEALDGATSILRGEMPYNVVNKKELSL